MAHLPTYSPLASRQTPIECGDNVDAVVIADLTGIGNEIVSGPKIEVDTVEVTGACTLLCFGRQIEIKVTKKN